MTACSRFTTRVSSWPSLRPIYLYLDYTYTHHHHHHHNRHHHQHRRRRHKYIKLICCIRIQITHWQHPRFHAYFPAGNSYPSILADMLSDAIGCVGFSWVSLFRIFPHLSSSLRRHVFSLAPNYSNFSTAYRSYV